MTTRTERIAMPNGGEMGAYIAVPETGGGPGVLVLMEIFGVGSYIRRACERLAELGYVGLAPDLYRRTEPGLALGHEPDDLPKAFEAMGKLDYAGAVEDAIVALDHLRGLPEVHPPVAVLGFCLGGSLAFEVAAQADPDAAVCYYGSTVADQLEQSDQIVCPVIFHYGAEDPYISLESSRRVERAASQRPGWECHIQPDAGHAFDNHDADMFHRPEPAARAWALTSDFLQRELAQS
jgi:carboxymethylenebutenolidase